MLKKRLIIVLAGLTLLATALGSTGFVAYAWEQSAAPPPCACHLPGHGTGSGGGGC